MSTHYRVSSVYCSTARRYVLAYSAKKRLKVLSSNLPVTHGFNISIATTHQHEAVAFVRTSMMDLPAVGPKFSGPACRAAAAIDRYLQLARARPQQQTHRPPLLLSIDGTDIRINGRTDT